MSAAPIPPHIAAIERPRESLMTYYVLKAIMGLVAFPFLLPYLYFRFHTMRYRFDTDGIHMKWGIIFRREVLLNYARIQDIHLRSNIIERWLGLARIEIQTASGSASANMTLEGMEDPEDMRDFLYSRMRGSREEKTAAADPLAAGCCMRSRRNCATFARRWQGRGHELPRLGETHGSVVGPSARGAARSRRSRRIRPRVQRRTELLLLAAHHLGTRERDRRAGLVGGVRIQFVPTMPPFVRAVWRVLGSGGVPLFAASIPVTYFLQRLNYEMRWYIVTDRSLRIRRGVIWVQEMTMTFANIQEVRVTANPIELLLGLANVEVHSAGGAVSSEHGTSSSGHVASFEGVDNAETIRDLLAERLRAYRDSGLGEKTEESREPPAVAAAREVLQEARALRAGLG